MNSKVYISFLTTSLIVFMIVIGLLYVNAAYASEYDRQGVEAPMDYQCMSAFLENARMNPNNATYLRDVWNNAGLNAEVCNKINGYPENYNEYH